MNEFLKYTDPSWHEVLTEQAERNSVCSGNSRNKINAQQQSWETDEQFNKRMFFYEFRDNERVTKAFRRILKYGHPKKCPAINKITNLILFL